MVPPPDTLAALQAAAIRFRDEREWAQFHTPKDLALGLTIEAGELAELFLWKTREQATAALRGDLAFRPGPRRKGADRQAGAHAPALKVPLPVNGEASVPTWAPVAMSNTYMFACVVFGPSVM